MGKLCFFLWLWAVQVLGWHLTVRFNTPLLTVSSLINTLVCCIRSCLPLKCDLSKDIRSQTHAKGIKIWSMSIHIKHRSAVVFSQPLTTISQRIICFRKWESDNGSSWLGRCPDLAFAVQYADMCEKVIIMNAPSGKAYRRGLTFKQYCASWYVTMR